MASVLDVGCGLGHFERFLRNFPEYKDVDYMGWDINPSFISHCTNTDRATFELRNILDTPPQENSVDVAVAIGTLNSRFHDNDGVVKKMLAALFSAAASTAILSATSIYADEQYKTDDMWHYDPVELFLFARKLTRYVDLLHGYMPHDFTLVLHKK